MDRFVVTEKAMRPASPLRQCFYCNQAVGAVHKNDCVLINRKVRVRMTVEYDIEVPAFWDADRIEFHRNEGSWCADNALPELEAFFTGGDHPCMCDATRFEYLGEAPGEPYLNE